MLTYILSFVLQSLILVMAEAISMSAEIKTTIGLEERRDVSLSMSIASTPEKDKTSTGDAQEQGMEQVLEKDKTSTGHGDAQEQGMEQVVAGDMKDGIEAPDPSQVMGELADESVLEMHEYEPIWRTYSNNQSLGIMEANRTRLQSRMYQTDPQSLTDKERMEMAVGFFKLSEDPSWNFKNYAESVNSIFQLARKAASNASRADQQDTLYQTALSMAWTDDDTALIFNSSVYH